MVQEYQHDTYKLRGKLKESTLCTECGAVFHKGRWTWEAKPDGACEIVCPACMRVRDKYPKGLLTVKGSFKDEQREQVMGLIRNTEAQEKQEHPLSRVMDIQQEREDLIVTTTDTHLPRRIGHALHHAYHGELQFHYDQDEDFIRVIWHR
jgi:NMD protein affecting ribosome stability and mRNA decay